MTGGDGVYISSGQVYQEVRTLAATVTRMDSKLDSLVERLASREALLQDHEDRLRALERKVWAAAGAGATVGALGGWLFGLM